jgi:hypothetical protein
MEIGTINGEDAGLIDNCVSFDVGEASLCGRIASELWRTRGADPRQGHFVANCVDLLDPMFSMKLFILSPFPSFQYAAKV